MDHLREGTRRVCAQPGGLSAATHTVADVGCGPASLRQRAGAGRGRRHRLRGRHASTANRRPIRDYRCDGVRIVDLTAFWAGPAATHSLAAFGADVVKVESIQRPDGIRYSGGMRTDVDDWWEYGWVFHAMNTNKRSVTLDLGSVEGRRLFQRTGRRGRRR